MMNTKSGEPLFFSDLTSGFSQLHAANLELWQERRRHIQQSVISVIGKFPARSAVRWRVVEEERASDAVLRQKIAYTVDDADEVPAYLLLPAKLAPNENQRPAILALHQTVPQGKEEVAGLQGSPDFAYGLELAERGYVVLVPDVLTAGERIYTGKTAYQSSPFEERYPEWSMMGKMIYDHSIGIDLLCSLNVVDQRRIGAIGHSLGGYNAFFLAAFDERVKVAVSSCGFSPFAGDPNPERWGKREEWFSHIPKVTEYLNQGQIPFEFHEVAAAIAPRAFLNWSAQNDHIFPHWEAIGQAMNTVKELYDGLNLPEQFVSILGNRRAWFSEANPRTCVRMAGSKTGESRHKGMR